VGTLPTALPLVFAAALIVASCGKAVWTKPSFTQAEYRRDTYECDRDVRQSYHGTGIAGALSARDFYDRCMEARGWEKVKQ
jgi:hypothetical protein